MTGQTPGQAPNRRSGNELGERGERFAARQLADAGYTILDRNRVVGRYEADLVALDPDGETVVIVEVKTRRSDFLPAEVNVHREKRRRLARLAAMLGDEPWCADRPLRFDVFAILWSDESASRPEEVRHFVDAFDASG